MKSSSKNILLLGASFTTNNLGVWTLASGAITSALNAFPGAKINLLDYSSTDDEYLVKYNKGTYSVKLVNIRFSKKFWSPNNIARLLITAMLFKIIPARRFHQHFLSRNSYLNYIQSADIIASIAGGDSFSDIYGLRRLIYVTLPQILVLLMGKPLILLPQTIGPFKSKSGKMLSQFILKRAKKIYSRDLESLREVNKLFSVNHGKLNFCYDMGFVLEPQISRSRVPGWLEKMDPAIPKVGINISGLLYIGGYNGKNMFKIKADYLKVIDGLVTLFVNKYGAEVILVPHVLGGFANDESDITACIKVYDNTNSAIKDHVYILENEYDHNELKALIGRCDFFIGSRMHACIAALSQCVPAVGLAYSRKFRGLFDTIGVGDLVVDLRCYNEHSVISKVKNAFEHKEYYKKQLEAKIPTARKKVLNIFNKNIG